VYGFTGLPLRLAPCRSSALTLPLGQPLILIASLEIILVLRIVGQSMAS
jgi:hypothetical protein